jgi:hypothetical protein
MGLDDGPLAPTHTQLVVTFAIRFNQIVNIRFCAGHKLKTRCLFDGPSHVHVENHPIAEISKLGSLGVTMS